MEKVGHHFLGEQIISGLRPGQAVDTRFFVEKSHVQKMLVSKVQITSDWYIDDPIGTNRCT